MSRYSVRFPVWAEITVTLEADDRDSAADAAWEIANEYAQTVLGNHRNVVANLSLDGIGTNDVEEMTK